MAGIVRARVSPGEGMHMLRGMTIVYGLVFGLGTFFAGMATVL